MASGTTVSSGGLQRVFSGGVANSAFVASGGKELVSSGGTASATTISGGLVEILSGGGIGTAALTFASGGTLQLDDSQHFSGQVSGFAVPDKLDLQDIPFGAGTTVSFTEAASGTSGTLVVSSGSLSASITLLGSYKTGEFNLAADAVGGTLVTDPPLSGGSGVANTTFDFSNLTAAGADQSKTATSPFLASTTSTGGSTFSVLADQTLPPLMTVSSHAGST